MSAAVEIAGLAKRYRTGAGDVDALAGIDLGIPQGGVFGILGPNGAGKSTLLRILTGLVRASAGEVRIFGAPLSSSALAGIGALVEAPAFYPYLTGRETLDMLACFHPARIGTADMLLDRVGIADAADRRVDLYSLGMKQRLAIAAALIGDPAIVILDEPTNGMDPGGIRDMRRLVRELADGDDRTVILSSHLLDEVQRTCDRVAILSHGRVVAEEAVARIGAAASCLRIEATPVEAVLRRLGPRGTREGDTVLAAIERHEVPALAASLVAEGIEIFELRWDAGSIEDVYFSTTRGRS